MPAVGWQLAACAKGWLQTWLTLAPLGVAPATTRTSSPRVCPENEFEQPSGVGASGCGGESTGKDLAWLSLTCLTIDRGKCHRLRSCDRGVFTGKAPARGRHRENRQCVSQGEAWRTSTGRAGLVGEGWKGFGSRGLRSSRTKRRTAPQDLGEHSR